MAGLPKDVRLLTKADYGHVFNKSVKVSNTHFLLLIHINSKPCSRMGLVISKKVDKRAVQRNRIKRIARESFRNYAFKNACDYIVLARHKTSQQPNNILFEALNQLWQQADIKITKINKTRNK